ncbi:glycosyltransferase [Blastopirellula marina]|uniref:Glycosyl transferase family 1 n=1 Tax=Blastopirellula marina TaxID=124 RepID=A0A2S8G0V1_9BACT|nr:glycosyltransferase [Blastopirellula marina]PQO38067.1 hypothetical protein C5Y98_08260 [Blastopirellula marina]PTL44723.1 hypothetical protein C5Y97_08260 [Blastopirellula marina]
MRTQLNDEAMVAVEEPKTECALRIAFAVGGLYTEASGVGRIVCDLANALARHSTPIDVYTAACGGQRTASHMLNAPNRCFSFDGYWLGRLSISPALNHRLRRDLEQFDLIHNHSFWMMPNHYASKNAHRHSKPVVFTAHGVLEPWALGRSRWKKRIAGLWFQDRDLRQSACIQVNSESEVKGIRDYGLRNNIAIIPNGVDLSVIDQSLDHASGRGDLRSKYPELRDKKICLFLSRLHEKKGLAHLIEAWSRIARDQAEWHLVIAGPDDGFEAEVRQRISGQPWSQSITLTGPLFGQDKYAALAVADTFVLPSFSEGFSMAVLEAMACRLPVLISPGCNFPEVARTGAGIEVEPTVDATLDGLSELMQMSDSQRQAMGERGRRMIEGQYTWDRVAQQTIELYRWLLGRAERPSCVLG